MEIHDFFMTFSRLFQDIFMAHFHDVRWKKSWKWWYLYTFSRHLHDFFTFSASSFSWQIRNSFTTFSSCYFQDVVKNESFFTTFSSRRCIFTRVSRHISQPTYFHDKFSNRKVSRHFHGLFTGFSWYIFTTHSRDVWWKSREDDIVQRYTFTRFSRLFHDDLRQ